MERERKQALRQRRQAMNAPIDNEAMKEREKQLEAGRVGDGLVTWLLNPRFLIESRDGL